MTAQDPSTPPSRGPSRPGPASSTRRPAPAAPPEHGPAIEPLAAGHPAFLAALIVAAACVLFSVTFVVRDPAFWQHLATGRAIAQLRSIPVTQLWTWPTYGAPDLNSSWAFGPILQTLWSAAGVWGVFALRWLAALATFGLLWNVARRLGARGLAPLVVLVVAALSYRGYAQARPELFAALFLALQLWILESRRRGGPDRAWALVPLSLAWVNLHPTWILGPVVAAAYLAADALAAERRAGARGLALVLAGMVLIAFVNPFGGRALAQPVSLALSWRDEPIAAALGVAPWLSDWTTGLPLLVIGWPLAIVLRARRHGWDVAEAALTVVFTALVIADARLAGLYAVAAAPFVARALDGALAGRTPAWASDPWRRAVIAGACCVAACLFQWTRGDVVYGVGVDVAETPSRACDFMAEHGVKGRGFNHLQVGGYMLHRFWPDRERLPFMDPRRSGPPENRRLYARAFTEDRGWQFLDDSYRFDYALLDASQHPAEADWLRDRLDADTAWVLVFLDDAGALFVRRSGTHAALARQFGYLAVPAGERRLELIGQGVAQDTMLRALTRMELERQIRESPYNARARSMLANVALADGRLEEASTQLAAALSQDPRTFAAHERLGMIALALGRPDEAVKEFEREMKLTGGTPELRARIEQAKLIRKNPGAAAPAGR